MLCRSYPWWGLSALQPLDVSLEFLESNKHVHLFCCQVEECCVRCAAYHEVHRLCCTQTWITHGLDESNIPLPPLQINQLSLLSSHWDLLRAAHSCVSPQEHVKGKQGICSGYIAVTPASMWIVVVLAASKQGLWLYPPFLCLKSLPTHYNIFCSSPPQILGWFVEWSDICDALVHWCGILFASENLVVQSRHSLTAWRSWEGEQRWEMSCFSKATSSAARVTVWLLGQGTERGRALCLNSPGTGPDVLII